MACPTRPIRQGRASSITDLGDGWILRLGGNPEAEATVMRLAADHGVPVPHIHEVRPDGLVMEFVPGMTLADEARRRPWRMADAVRIVVDLHRRVHGVPFDGARLLHFDLHPENVLMAPDGPVLIDWTNARGGDPDSDLAMTWLIAETSAGIGGRVFAWQLA